MSIKPENVVFVIVTTFVLLSALSYSLGLILKFPILCKIGFWMFVVTISALISLVLFAIVYVPIEERLRSKR